MWVAVGNDALVQSRESDAAVGKGSGENEPGKMLAEGEGFEPPVALRLRLISSQVPSTTQPPFQPAGGEVSRRVPGWQAPRHGNKKESARLHEAIPWNPLSVASSSLRPNGSTSGSRSPQNIKPCTNPNGIQAMAQGRRACEATLGEAPEGDFNRNAVVAIVARNPTRPGAAMLMQSPATTALRLEFMGMVFPG